MSSKTIPKPVIPSMPSLLTMNHLTTPFPYVLCHGENCSNHCMPYSKYCRKCGHECNKCGRYSKLYTMKQYQTTYRVYSWMCGTECRKAHCKICKSYESVPSMYCTSENVNDMICYKCRNVSNLYNKYCNTREEYYDKIVDDLLFDMEY